VYAVTTGDVDGNGKPDIVAITSTQLIWFESPTWRRRLVVEKVTARDNVALAPFDIDSDGKLDFALGADWQSTNTSGGGSLHWVSNAGQVHNIATEPTLHRIRWADVDGDSRPELVVAPLRPRNESARLDQKSQAPHPGVQSPTNPAKDRWAVEVADDSLHIVHNFTVVGNEIWLASAEGIFVLSRAKDGRWSKRLIGEGKPGEIKVGRADGKRHIAAVEPWHGQNIVVYEERDTVWKRTVIESGLAEAHALGWGDFDGDRAKNSSWAGAAGRGDLPSTGSREPGRNRSTTVSL
jgi:hypothetical protein